MDIVVMGQLLLGCLLVIALLVNGLLLRLRWRLRRAFSEAPLVLNALLLWAPVFLLAVGIGGAALAGFNLLTFRNGQDTSGVSWFMLGTCLVIFANVCSAFILIRLRETLNIALGANRLEMGLLSLGTPGRANLEEQAKDQTM